MLTKMKMFFDSFFTKKEQKSIFEPYDEPYKKEAEMPKIVEPQKPKEETVVAGLFRYIKKASSFNTKYLVQLFLIILFVIATLLFIALHIAVYTLPLSILYFTNVLSKNLYIVAMLLSCMCVLIHFVIKEGNEESEINANGTFENSFKEGRLTIIRDEDGKIKW